MENRKKPYLLTGGLVPLIENRHKIQLNKRTKEALRGIELSYFNTTSNILNGKKDIDNNGEFVWNIEFISDSAIENSLNNLINQRNSNRPLISFDDVYCQNLPNGHYHATRIQDPNRLDDSPQLGPRLKSPDLEIQVSNIGQKYGKEIDVMDIGVFGGDTLSREIKRFQDGGIKIKDIYVMIAGREGVDRIANLGSNLKYVKKIEDWVDWLEMRDCVGFDGRKVKMSNVDINSQNSFVRYLERANKWASIPEEFEKTYQEMYNSYFNNIKDILSLDGISVNLNKSKDHNLVYELRLDKE